MTRELELRCDGLRVFGFKNLGIIGNTLRALEAKESETYEVINPMTDSVLMRFKGSKPVYLSPYIDWDCHYAIEIFKSLGYKYERQAKKAIKELLESEVSENV